MSLKWSVFSVFPLTNMQNSRCKMNFCLLCSWSLTLLLHLRKKKKIKKSLFKWEKKSQPAQREVTLEEWKMAFSGLSWFCCYLLESLLDSGCVNVSAAQSYLYLLLFIQHTHFHNSTLFVNGNKLANTFVVSFLNCEAYLKCLYQRYWTNLVFLSLFFSLWSSSSFWTATTTIKGKSVFGFVRVCVCVSSPWVVYKLVQHFSRVTSLLFLVLVIFFPKHTWINNGCEEAISKTFNWERE